MLQKLLVPLDGTPFSEAALAPAAELAKRLGASLVLLVRSTSVWPKDRPVPADELDAMFEAETYLRTIAGKWTSEGLKVQMAVLSESPAESISAEAEYHQCDLIVMTTHGRGGLTALFSPSVMWEVLRQTKTPVLAWKVKEDEAGPETPLPRFLREAHVPLVVPLDGSLQAEQALPLAQELARGLNLPLVLVRAAEQPFIAGSAIDYAELLMKAQEWAAEEARSYLERKRLELTSAGLRVEIESSLGSPALVIERAVQQHQAGLVVMASHGRGGLGRLLLGSVAKQVLGQLDVPVALVRV